MTSERFASPLNLNPGMECPFSMYTEVALFGANVDAYAYSVKWTGASHMNPEHKAVVMDKAMGWTVLSAKEAAESVFTALVLPWWDDKGSSYARCLSHQPVQVTATLTRASATYFDAPIARHWADEQDLWCTTKCNVQFLMVANDAAGACCMGRHSDYDLSIDYTQFKGQSQVRYWLQQTIQVQTQEGSLILRAYTRD